MFSPSDQGTLLAAAATSCGTEHSRSAAGARESRESTETRPLFEPKTIADFEWLWESCREPLVIHYPVGLAYRYIFATEAGDTQSGDWTESSPGCPGGVDEDAACHPKLIPTTHFSGAAPLDFDYVLTGPCDRPGTGALVGRIAIPAATGSVAFDALPRLQRFFAQWAPQPGPYGRAFPELSSLSRRFRNETFEVAEQILQGVRDQTAASHQVLGVSVPADSVSFLGIIVLLSAQWYFVVQLAEFAERVRVDASVWDVAWVGLYPALSARFLFVASAMLAPPLMTLLLGRKRGDWVTATLGLGVSAFLSVMAWRSWTQARQHRPGQDEVKT